jgi:nitrite reductase (NADH) small subunit
LRERPAGSARPQRGHQKAAAPHPAPPERTDRTFILALADVEWLMRELIPIKRHARRVPPEVLLERYRTSARPDPLPDLSIDLVRAIAMIPRGRMLKTASDVAGMRHALPELRRLIAPEAPPLRPIELGARVRVCPLAELKEGCGRAVEAFGRTIAVFRDHGTLKAIDDVCPHRGGPLNQGDVENGAVICPLHGWAFDLESGKMRGNPRIIVPTYEVMIEGDDVFVGTRKK